MLTKIRNMALWKKIVVGVVLVFMANDLPKATCSLHRVFPRFFVGGCDGGGCVYFNWECQAFHNGCNVCKSFWGNCSSS